VVAAEEDRMAHTVRVVEARAVRKQRMHQNDISRTKQELQRINAKRRIGLESLGVSGGVCASSGVGGGGVDGDV